MYTSEQIDYLKARDTDVLSRDNIVTTFTGINRTESFDCPSVLSTMKSKAYSEVVQELMKLVEERLDLENQARLIEEEMGRVQSEMRFQKYANPEMHHEKFGGLIEYRADLGTRIVATIENAAAILDQIEDPEILANIKQIYSSYLKIMYPKEENELGCAVRVMMEQDRKCGF